MATATYRGHERRVAMTVSGSLRHLHAIGPTGIGKSTLLLNLITQDMDDGRSVVVIEPKGDLIADVLARVPGERLGRRADRSQRQGLPVGLNPLAPMGRSPELVADQLLGVFHKLYPRIGGRALRTSWVRHCSRLPTAGIDSGGIAPVAD